jgi:TonB family protein
VYSSGDGLRLPELIPIASILLPIDNCKKRIDGEVSLFFVVDTTGTPRNLLFDRPLGSDLDRFALQIVSSVRFRPGNLNGNPVVVAQKAKVRVETCLVESTDGSGSKRLSLQLRSMPKIAFSATNAEPSRTVLTIPDTPQAIENGTARIYKIGGDLTPPIALIAPPVYPEIAWSVKFSGTCIISVVVDSQGMPQNLKLGRTIGHGLDEKAVEAVHRYRFKPAMKNGVPVASKIDIEINFRLNQ